MEYHSGGSLPLLGRPRYCPGANANGGYLCETGHCCGETGCCTYYYELWWFWLLWTVLILFSCCCAYRHRRAKLRVQQQQRQREISLLAYHGASSYPSSMLDLSFLASLKLPSYEEVAAQPSTPPPPYSSVFTTPRYPQPPRTVDPHLLTQHGPLLHRPLSDGPSSLSSDNSSSCSCDSCCPSSPCSSSLSAPVTYETDTSHASTPSEAMPLTLDVTMENITEGATFLEVNQRVVSTVTVDVGEEDAAGAQERLADDSLVPNQTVTVAVVTRAASPESELAPPAKQQLDLTPSTPIASTCSSSSLPSPSVVEAALPSIQISSIDEPAEAPKATPGPSTPTEGTSDRPAETLSLTRTFNAANVPSSPTSVLSPHVGRTLALITGSSGLPAPDPSPGFVPVWAPSHPTQAADPVSTPLTHTSESTRAADPLPTDLTPSPDPVLPNLPQAPEPGPSNITPVPDPDPDLTLVPDSNHVPNSSTDTAPTSPSLFQSQNPDLDLVQLPETVAASESRLDSDVAPDSGPCVVQSQLSDSLPSNIQTALRSGPGSGPGSGSGPPSSPAPVLTLPRPPSSSSCPAITIEPESNFVPVHSPRSALSPSSPPFLPSPPAPALLLDPLTALHQSDKGGSSSGHASSLSPSPRATQSPPKQTLFSPCVDVFEPGPPNWEDEEEEQEVEDNDDEDDDVGADESQYRHRRLTGDSGIEVCRCRVEEKDDEEEEEEERERKEDGGERDKKGDGNSDLHDSVDCPARGQITTGEGLALCNPNAATTPTSEDGGEVVIVMETV